MRRGVCWAVLLALLAGCGGGASVPGEPPPADPGPAPLPPFVTVAPAFTDVTAQAGVLEPDAYTEVDYKTQQFNGRAMAGGACAGDFDGDGWLDLYHVRGASGRNRLYRNKGDGTFEDVAAAAGVDVEAADTSGPTFVDYDGDGDLDLFLGGMVGRAPQLFRNKGDGTFEDVTIAAGLVFTRVNNVSAAFGDYDRDGDLDMFVAHWELQGQVIGSPQMLWRNNGDGTFTDVSGASGITAMYIGSADYSFTPNFTDIDSDGWLDVLLTSDFETSRILRNRGNGTFADITTDVISDKSGMGAGVGDYDNDGDLDWFVSSIFDVTRDVEDGPDPTQLSGNRLYRNNGLGVFEDVTTAAGVRLGYWGWGSAFIDFNNDCWLDIYHTNGWFGRRAFDEDPSRLFVSNGDGTFTEASLASGIDDTRQGRGIVCFDFDRDGDMDIFQANLNEPGRLFRNDTPADLGWLHVTLRGKVPNTEGVGARIHVSIGGLVQMRELRCGNNYVSANPVEAHFGLGPATSVDTVRVAWPDGKETLMHGVARNQRLVITHPDR